MILLECGFKMSEGRKCTEQVEREGKCIFHLENKSDKEIEKFKPKFDELLQDAIDKKDGDFTGFIIPYIKNIGYDHFNKKMNFESVIFEGDVNFSDITFNGDMNFQRSTFKKKANFSKVIFNGKVNFSLIYFDGETDFSKSRFNSDTNFDQSIFEDLQNNLEANFIGTEFNKVSFVNIEFYNGSDFSFSIFKKEAIFVGIRCMSEYLVLFQNIKFYEPKHVTFQGIHFENISFLHTDVSNIEFVGDKWIKLKDRLFLFFHTVRIVVIDEIIIENRKIGEYEKLKGNYEKHYEFIERSSITQLYRRLRQNFENNYRFAEAGDFFIGEMEMRRLDVTPRPTIVSKFENIRELKKNKLWIWFKRNISILGIYKYLGLYGENYIIPAIYALLVIVLYPILIFWIFGISIPDDLYNYMRKSEMNFFLMDRSYMGENLLGILIIGLFTIALKRKFERKK